MRRKQMRYNFEWYCKNPEKIENYEKAKADGFKGWDCHHRLETHNSDGLRRPVDITRKELVALGMYYHRPASELIFLTSSEHSILHKKGKPRTEETKHKIGEAQKGNKYALGYKHSEEAKKKNSEAQKGEKNSFYGKHHTEESKKKISEAKKGKHLGKDNPFYGKTHSEETKKKLSEAKKGMHWFNNGKMNIRAKECPEGFVPGILK